MVSVMNTKSLIARKAGSTNSPVVVSMSQGKGSCPTQSSSCSVGDTFAELGFGADGARGISAPNAFVARGIEPRG